MEKVVDPIVKTTPIRKPTNQPNDNDTFETDPSH